jgi:hypothetical protein
LKKGWSAKFRDRDTVNSVRRGQKLHDFGGCSVQLTDDIVLSTSEIGAYRVAMIVILSWRRGRWEDLVSADAITSRSISEVFLHGLLRVETT